MTGEGKEKTLTQIGQIGVIGSRARRETWDRTGRKGCGNGGGKKEKWGG